MICNTELKNKIKNPTDLFKKFIEQYFESNTYLYKGEWDRDIPKQLRGEELYVAKEIIAINIKTGLDSVLYSARILDTKEVIPEIEELCRNSNSSLLVKYHASSCLYQWTNGAFIEFVTFCRDLLSNKDSLDSGTEYVAEELLIGITGLLNRDVVIDMLFMALQNKNIKIRSSAYFSLKYYILEKSENIFRNVPYDYNNEKQRAAITKMIQHNLKQGLDYSFVAEALFQDQTTYLHNLQELRNKYE